MSTKNLAAAPAATPRRRLWLVLAAFGLMAPMAGAQTAPTPLSLEEAKTIALGNHPRYASAQLETFLAQAALKEARAGYFPTADGYIDAVGATSDNTRIMAGGLNNPSIYDRVAGGVAVTQLITDFGRTGNLTASARARVRGQAAGAESTREQIILNAETSYFAALQAQSVLEVARQTLASRQLVLQQVRALADNQLKSSLDVSFAQVALEEANLLIQQAEGQAESTLASLSTALGYRDARPFILTDRPPVAGPPAPVQDLIAAALRDRPDLQRLRFEEAAAKSSADAEKDANYPTIAAVGAAGNSPWHDAPLRSNYAAGGIQMSIPLFAGGAYLAREHEAQIRAQVADDAVRDAEDNAARDVRIAWIGVNTAVQRLRTTDQLMVHAAESFNLAQARYRAGSSSVVELNEAQLSQTTAAITQANARYDTLIENAVLDYQVGALK